MTAPGPRVLVVEDEMLIAAELEAVLQDAGYVVVGPFPRVAQALAALAQAPVHAAVLDVNVNGELIFPVVEELEAHGAPMVFCTGYADLQASPARLRDHPRLSKPAAPEAVLRALDDLLGRRS